MEGVFADSLVKECKMFCFGMPSNYIKYFVNAGFNLISVGNITATTSGNMAATIPPKYSMPIA